MRDRIIHIVHEHATADELLQETFGQVWQKAGAYAGRGTVTAWLYRIARNKSLDQLRRQKARPRAVEMDLHEDEQALWNSVKLEITVVEQAVERNWRYQSLRQALTEIPNEQRYCLELAYFEGMSQQKIAEYTNTPLGTVKTRLRLGLEKLERIFQTTGY